MLSGALLARHVWGLEAAATRIEAAVEASLRDGQPGTTQGVLEAVLRGL